MPHKLAWALLLACGLRAQSLPLEGLVLERTAISRDAVMRIAALKLGAPVNKAAIEAACAKLGATGLFDAVSYRYATGPKRGYILTLTIDDQKQLTAASIDIPGADDAALWQWLIAQYPPFDHKVPSNEIAQDFVAHALADRAKTELDGQPLTARMETDLAHHSILVSFQPAVLPKIGELRFAGEHELSAEALAGLLTRLVAAQGYTDRRFRQLVEANLRPAYEDHGMYRVKFPKISVQRSGAGAVAVTTEVEEGPKYTLGEVTFAGDKLPLDAMLKAAKFKKGQTANWTEIQQGLWDAEKPVKRSGYFNATSHAERIFHDDQLAMDVKVSFVLGPLYRFGELKIIGLTTEQEARARKAWKVRPEDPYDYAYANEFLQTFVRSDPAGFKKYSSSAEQQPNQVMDVTLLFEAK